MLMMERRSLRMTNGPSSRVTSVCLEKPFWDLLEQMAEESSCTLPQLISLISDHCRQKSSDYYNGTHTLASSLRVYCLRWLESRAPHPSHDGRKVMIYDQP